jgi:hypothetical protein
MSARDKAVNYLSMAVGGAVGVTVGYVIYRRTMARAAEIAAESLPGDVVDGSPSQPGTPDYADIEAGLLLDPDRAATLMGDDDDDLAMWDAPESAYRDADDGPRR